MSSRRCSFGMALGSLPGNPKSEREVYTGVVKKSQRLVVGPLRARGRVHEPQDRSRTVGDSVEPKLARYIARTQSRLRGFTRSNLWKSLRSRASRSRSCSVSSCDAGAHPASSAEDGSQKPPCDPNLKRSKRLRHNHCRSVRRGAGLVQTLA